MNAISNNISYRLVLILFCASLGLILGGQTATDIVGVLLIILTLGGRGYTLLSLFLFPIVKLANPALVAYSSVIGVGFWLAVLLSFCRNIPLIFKGDYLTVISPMWLFAFSAFCSSVFFSENLDVSLLKLVSLLMTIITIIAIASDLTKEEVVAFEINIKTIMIFVTLFSIPFYFIPNIGFLLNHRGFQGFFGHPQNFAVFLVPIFTMFLMGVFQKEHGSRLVLLTPLIIVFWLVLTTKARTAVLASAFSVMIPIITTLVVNCKYTHFLNRTKFFTAASLVTMISIGGLAFSDSFSNFIDSFIHKDHSKESVSESFYKSRGANVENHIKNFEESPLLGWGFGVIPHGMKIEQAKTFLGLPISAPVEKGFVITAVLEETGIIGFILFLAWIIKMCSVVFNKEKPVYIACFLSCLLINFGEAVFFSMAGIGLIFWVIMGFILGRKSISEPV